VALIKEVARQAGVSPSTVSRVLNGSAGVSPAKEAKVRAAVEALNYIPNSVAKSLKLGKSNTIAILIPNINNLVYPEIVRGIEDCARENGYTVILCNTSEDMEQEKNYVQTLLNRQVDGMIVASYTEKHRHIDELNKRQFPIVLALRGKDESFNTVGVDNAHWAYQAVRYLLEQGHRNVAIAVGDLGVRLYQQRLEGYKKALAEYGIPFDEDYLIYDQVGPDSVYDGVCGLVKSGRKVDAIFTSNDYRAFVALSALKELGVRVPGDISVMGFDGVRMSALVSPTLSTVQQPMYQIGEKAMKRLVAMIQAEKPLKPELRQLKANLLIRESTKSRER